MELILCVLIFFIIFGVLSYLISYVETLFWKTKYKIENLRYRDKHGNLSYEKIIKYDRVIDLMYDSIEIGIGKDFFEFLPIDIRDGGAIYSLKVYINDKELLKDFIEDINEWNNKKPYADFPVMKWYLIQQELEKAEV